MTKKTETVKETAVPSLPGDLEVGGMLTDLFDPKISYARKKYVVEFCTEKAVAGVKQNFLLLGFLADYAINGSGPSFFHAQPDFSVNFLDFARIKFQVEKSTVYAAMNCFQSFCAKSDKTGFALKPEYQDFSQSQLVEMLPLSVDQRKQIIPSMTVKEIRQVKQKLLPKKEKKKSDVYGDGHRLMKELGIVKEVSSDEEFFGCPEAIVIEPAEPVLTSKLVTLTNDKQRKEWLHNYEKWGVWLDVAPLDMKYYRYDFGNGDYVIVTVQKLAPTSYNKEGKHEYYSLVRKNGYPSQFNPGGNAQSMITDYLREQKIAVMQF